MAFSFSFPNSTLTIQSLYNSFYFFINSSNYNKTNFKYIIDLSCTYCKNNTTIIGQNLGRYKVYPDPSTFNGYFTPHSIFQNFVDNEDFNPKTTIIKNVCSWVIFTTSFGEEYDLSPLSATTGTTIYPSITGYTSLGINSVFDFNQIGMNLNVYDSKNLSNSFLTRFLSSWNLIYYKPIYRNTFETLQILDSSGGVTGFKNLKIYTYNFSGGSVGEYNITNNVIPSIKLEIPAGTKNLNITALNLLTNTNRLIIDSDVSSYILEYKNVANVISEQFLFQIIDDCPKYSPVTISWLEQLGSFGYWHFRLKSREDIKISTDTWVKRNGYDYNANRGDRGTKTLYINGDKTLEVTTGWLKQHEVDYISQLFTSPSIYLINNGNPDKIPLTLNTKEFEIKKIENETLINYTFNFSFAQKIYRQNG